MKNKVFALAVAMVAAFSMAACIGGSGGGKMLNSTDALKEYIDSQPANSPDKPIKVSMSVNDMLIENVGEVIDSAGKYVSLDLSRSVGLTTIGYGTFYNVKALASITIPDSVTSIGRGAFYDCTSLTSITFLGTIPSSGFGSSTDYPSFTIYDYCPAFDGDLRDKFYATDKANRTPGTYTRASGDSETWTRK